MYLQREMFQSLGRSQQCWRVRVLSILMRMPEKFCNLDPVPAKVLKQLAPYLIKEITKIVNISLTHGEYAMDWKIATVKPLLKKIGMSLQEKSSFRPVSNLTFLAKLVEKCMLSQFNTHCRLFNLLPSYQSAYREHHSCETSLIKLVNRSLWSIERQRVNSIIVMDLLAAFDLVNFYIFVSSTQRSIWYAG